MVRVWIKMMLLGVGAAGLWALPHVSGQAAPARRKPARQADVRKALDEMADLETQIEQSQKKNWDKQKKLLQTNRSLQSIKSNLAEKKKMEDEGQRFLESLDADTLHHLGSIESRVSEDRQVIRSAREGINLSSAVLLAESPSPTASPAYLLGLALLNSGHHDRAIVASRRILRLEAQRAELDEEREHVQDVAYYHSSFTKLSMEQLRQRHEALARQVGQLQSDMDKQSRSMQELVGRHDELKGLIAQLAETATAPPQPVATAPPVVAEATPAEAAAEPTPLAESDSPPATEALTPATPAPTPAAPATLAAQLLDHGPSALAKPAGAARPAGAPVPALPPLDNEPPPPWISSPVPNQSQASNQLADTVQSTTTPKRAGEQVVAEVPYEEGSRPLVSQVSDAAAGDEADRSSTSGTWHLFWRAKPASVMALGAGQVLFAGPFSGYRHLLIIDHGGGWRTLYTNLTNCTVKQGDPIKVGQSVGQYQANQGTRAEPLRFQVRQGILAVDPQAWPSLPSEWEKRLFAQAQ